MNVIFQNKMGVYRRLKALVLAGLLGVIALGSSNSFADSVNCYGVNFAGIGGGIGAPSLPAFGTYINAASRRAHPAEIGGHTNELDLCVFQIVVTLCNAIT